MSESNADQPYAVLNLSPDEKRAFSFLFDKADTDQLGVITGERAVAFFERTSIPSPVLGEIWGIADQENRGLLTKPGFSIALRLIGHYQSGKQLSPELAFQPGPLPRFEGLQLPTASSALQSPTSPSRATFPPAALQPQNSGQGIRIPPLDPQKVAQYTGLFERSGAQNGLLDGQTAKAIFERAGLPVDTLGKIWTLADREQRGALDQTEFIVAMHLLTSMKSKTMTALPSTLPTGFYDAAARRGAPPPPQARQPGAQPRQFSGASVGAPVRTSSPLARGAYNASPAAAPWLISAPEKAKYDQFFANIDTQGRGTISGEQAVGFFSESGLSEDTLASIWDLADINSEGQLNKDEFAVAMYLIRQQRASNAAALPAFLPPQLIPPSMRKPGLQQQTQQTTAPSFDQPSKPTLPRSAAEDLFGLDEPAQATSQQPLAPSATGGSVTRDPFSTSAIPSSPSRSQPLAQTSSTFKPFIPSSAFGASLAQQSTGESQASATPATRGLQQPSAPSSQPSAMDDLLGDDEAGAEQRSKINNDTTELANMSNQIGNLRNQMEQTQAKKSTAQTELGSTNSQKQQLEVRLQQFRAQYEQEVRTVKDLEQQLTASRESTTKLGQELALLEGTYQDLQTQHQNIFSGLQADQTENANLKQKIAQINAEVAKLRPEIEKMKLDARQQKGMVSINKKQLATNEAEHDRMQGEKSDLEREAAEAEASRALPTQQSPPVVASDIVSPAGSTMSANNPFFRRPATETAPTERDVQLPSTTQGAANPTAFDQLFGPSFANESKSPPPATSFGGRAAPVVAATALGTVAGAALGSHMTDSISTDGKMTPVATPPLSEDHHDIPVISEPPPPPEAGQFKPANLPVGGLKPSADDDTMSTSVAPPASRAGFADTPGPSSGAITPTTETVPGAFPSESGPSETYADKAVEPKSDFDSAFASFGTGEKSVEARPEEADPFDTSFPKTRAAESNGFSSEFPPIQSLEPEHDDSDSDSDDGTADGFGDSFNKPAAAKAEAPAATSNGAQLTADRPMLASVPSTNTELPPITAQTSPPTYEQSEVKDGDRSASNDFPKEFTGLLPARENPESLDTAFSSPSEVDTPRAVPVKQPSFPITTPTSTVDTFHDAFSRPLSSVTDDGVAGSSGQQSLNEAARAPAAPSNVFDEFDDFDGLAEAKEAEREGGFDFGFGGHTRDNSDFTTFDSAATSTIGSNAGTNGFTPSASATSPFATGATANSSIQNTPQGQHDWDAIFSGLDSSKTGDIDTSFGNDPWAPTNGSTSTPAAGISSSAQGKQPVDHGKAATIDTEQDDPFLKRLTGMGFPRADALSALERYDYDIGKAVDHLSMK